MLEDYFLKAHSEELEEILNASGDKIYHSIYVNFIDLHVEDPEIANKILRRPRHYLPLCDASMVSAQEKLAGASQKVKTRVHTRIVGCPIKAHLSEIGKLIAIVGIVVRMSQPTVIKLSKRYNCRKCKHITVVHLEWERNTIPIIKECEACQSSNIEAVPCLQQEDCTDHQEIKIQDKCQPDSNSSSITGWQVVLLDDLVDKCRPGDQVQICGIVIRRWASLQVGQRSEATSFLLANCISVQRKVSESRFSTKEMKELFMNYWNAYVDKPLVGRDIILASICPQLYGMYLLKLALAVILAGGVTKTNASGTKVRGEPHLLLIGDPGTGKSQILRTASRLAVRSVRTTGVGSTAAGLTAAAVKDSDGWHLEAGALVLADGGVCCVDEFATMSSHDRACVHEAMEQQTISIAKAGLVSTLNSRCTVIAAINPIGGQFTEDTEYQTRLGNPLLSRFDLILLLKDSRNPDWDKMTSDHILKAACESPDENNKTTPNENQESLKSNLWKEDDIREYLAHVHSLKPVLTSEADKILRSVFLQHRFDPGRRDERKTVRMLESLVRLAEGHARLMYRSEVIVMDAIVAAQLVGATTGLGKEIGFPFPNNPMDTYYEKGLELLSDLGLSNLENFL